MTTGSMRVCGIGGRSRRVSARTFGAAVTAAPVSVFVNLAAHELQRAYPHLAAHHQQGPEQRWRPIQSPHQDGSTCQPQMPSRAATVGGDVARRSQTKRGLNAPEYI